MKKLQLKDRHRHQKKIANQGGFSLLSQDFIGNIYQALTGNVPASPFARRAVANGLPEDQFQDAIRSARTSKSLPDYLLAASEQKHERALYWDELGLKARARDLYLESALWAVYAELLCEDEEKRSLIWQKYRESYRRAAPHFNHAAEEINIHYMASTLGAYFRLPQTDQDAATSKKLPVVVLLNSLFSAREEFHYFENTLLSQGFATLTIEYPGIQLHSGQTPSGFDIKELGNAIYLYLSTRPEIDNSRIALYGQSLGGRIAIYLMLLNPERFSSVVSMSTPLNLLSDLDKTTPQFAREHMVSNYAARTALYELALHTQIEDGLEHISAPLLVLGGGKDKIAGAEQTRDLFDRSLSADKKLVLCPGAGHCLYEMMPSLRYEIAQWIRQRV